MNNLSIEFKIIIAIVFFTFSIVALERYKLSGNIIDQFIESKESKNKLLIDTISPIVGVNLFLGLDSANKGYLDQIVKQNSDLNFIRLIDTDANTIYSSSKNANTMSDIDRNGMNFTDKNIQDTITGNKLATLELYFLNSEYKLFLEKNRETTIEIFFITFFLLTVFIVAIKREFRHLKELSESVLSYDPKIDNIKLTKTRRMDEVGIIHNAIVSMEEKIGTHTKLLDETNSLLEEKVKQRTKELNELNESLNNKVALAVKSLEDKNQLILQQSRLAQMGEMISMIAHQWRQPLASISSVAMDLNIKIQFDNFQEKYFMDRLDDINSFTQHLSVTIDDFRNFFEPTSGKKKISYENIIVDSLKIIKNSLNGKKIKISKNIASNRVYLTYANELKQVLINLISNASDVLTEQGIQNPEILIETLVVDDNEILRVSDNGGGIPDDIIDKIFDPYFSTKKGKNGTGLGLYMSKMIIEEHCSGKIKSYNNEVGAVFEIILFEGNQKSTA